jgi:hypothetical protein
MKQQPVMKAFDLEKLRRDILKLRQALARQEILRKPVARPPREPGKNQRQQRLHGRG